MLLFSFFRDTIQVKTHAQVMLKKLDEGQDIFEELDLDNAAAYPYYEMYGFYTAPRDSATTRIASEEPSFMGGSEMFKNVSDELTVAESLLQLAGTSETNPWAASSASIYIL